MAGTVRGATAGGAIVGDEVSNRAETRHLVETACTLFRLGRLAVTTLGAPRERGGDDESARRDLLSGERIVVFPDSPFLPDEMPPFRSPR